MSLIYQSKALESYRCKRTNVGLLNQIELLSKPGLDILNDQDPEVYEIEPPKPKANECFEDLTCDDKILTASLINKLAKAESDEERLILYQKASEKLAKSGNQASMIRIDNFLKAKSAEISAKKKFEDNKEKYSG